MENICNVKNRSGSHVVYNVPEIGVRRSFAPGEVKKISYEELKSKTLETVFKEKYYYNIHMYNNDDLVDLILFLKEYLDIPIRLTPEGPFPDKVFRLHIDIPYTPLIRTFGLMYI